MAGKGQPEGLSVIEGMAKKHHEGSHHLTRWDALSVEDKKRLMDAMEAAVGVIPDQLILKAGTITAKVKTGPAREGLLSEHRQAKRSALYGR